MDPGFRKKKTRKNGASVVKTSQFYSPRLRHTITNEMNSDKRLKCWQVVIFNVFPKNKNGFNRYTCGSPRKKQCTSKNMNTRKKPIVCLPTSLISPNERNLVCLLTSLASSIGALPHCRTASIDKNIARLDWLDTIHSLGHSRTSLQISEMLAQVLLFRKKVG